LPVPTLAFSPMAFKVYNYHEKQQKANKERRDNTKFQMLAQVLWQNPSASNSQGQGKSRTPPSPCFQCGLEGHWAHACPKICCPPGPCPKCKQEGHWARDCPSTSQGEGSRPPQHSSFLTDFLGLATMAEDWWSPGLPGPKNITSEEPRVMAIIDGRPIFLLIDTSAIFSALLEFWGSISLLQPP
jgi:hypothetical protein